MKAPKYRYLDPRNPSRAPFKDGTAEAYFFEMESMFYWSCTRRGERNTDAEARMLSAFWDSRAKGTYLDTLESQPVEDRALLLWWGAHLERFSPGATIGKAQIDAYFSRPTSR